MNSTAELETKARTEGWNQTDLYRFFAYVLGPPTAERYERLHRPEFTHALADLWRELGCTGGFPGLKGFEDFKDYESAYIALFDIGVPGPPVPLVESGHYKSAPAQQTALENVLFYEVLGLKADAARTVPDHLLTQLEFLSIARYLNEHAAKAENSDMLSRLERDFLERHLLNWTPAAQKKLNQLDPPVFSCLFRLLVQFLSRRFQELPQAQAPSVTCCSLSTQSLDRNVSQLSKEGK